MPYTQADLDLAEEKVAEMGVRLDGEHRRIVELIDRGELTAEAEDAYTALVSTMGVLVDHLMRARMSVARRAIASAGDR